MLYNVYKYISGLKKSIKNKVYFITTILVVQIIIVFLYKNVFLYIINWHVYISYLCLIALLIFLFKYYNNIILVFFVIFLFIFWNIQLAQILYGLITSIYMECILNSTTGYENFFKYIFKIYKYVYIFINYIMYNLVCCD